MMGTFFSLTSPPIKNGLQQSHGSVGSLLAT